MANTRNDDHVVRLPKETVESLKVEVLSDIDPTGDTVEFSVVAQGVSPSTWTAGSWDGTYADGSATAVTPTIGYTGSGADVELAVGSWIVYIKITDNPEVPVRACGIVKLQ